MLGGCQPIRGEYCQALANQRPVLSVQSELRAESWSLAWPRETQWRAQCGPGHQIQWRGMAWRLPAHNIFDPLAFYMYNSKANKTSDSVHRSKYI